MHEGQGLNVIQLEICFVHDPWLHPSRCVPSFLDLRYTFSKSTNFSYPRAFVIHTASLEVERVFITESKCIVHFLDVDNITIAKNYLKHAWYAGLLGPNNIHVVNIEYSTYDPMELMFPEIFDFQKLFIAEHRVKVIAFTCIRII